MRRVLFALFLPLLIICIDSCCKAGTGGKATLNISVITTNGPVKGATVYVKYNAGAAPGPTNVGYDDNKTCTNTNNLVSFTGLECGSYYFYAQGFDSIGHVPVYGGGPITIKHSDRNNTQSKTMNITF